MKRVYTELENYIEGLSEEERVRFVTEFHDMFDSGTADYDDEHITALYVMKYARAYGFQFSRAYADIFADMNNPESIKAVSIGCGTGIDYWECPMQRECWAKHRKVSLITPGLTRYAGRTGSRKRLTCRSRTW
ncbi:MAG: hypothetical protein ACLTDF_02690 [Coprococcus sp.]